MVDGGDLPAHVLSPTQFHEVAFSSSPFSSLPTLSLPPFCLCLYFSPSWLSFKCPELGVSCDLSFGESFHHGGRVLDQICTTPFVNPRPECNPHGESSIREHMPYTFPRTFLYLSKVFFLNLGFCLQERGGRKGRGGEEVSRSLLSLLLFHGPSSSSSARNQRGIE